MTTRVCASKPLSASILFRNEWGTYRLTCRPYLCAVFRFEAALPFRLMSACNRPLPGFLAAKFPDQFPISLNRQFEFCVALFTDTGRNRILTWSHALHGMPGMNKGQPQLGSSPPS